MPQHRSTSVHNYGIPSVSKRLILGGVKTSGSGYVYVIALTVCSVIWDTLHEQRIQEGDTLHEVKLKYCKQQTLG